MADAAPSSGETFHFRLGSGGVVKQLPGVSRVGGSNPGRVSFGGAAVAKSQPTKI